MRTAIRTRWRVAHTLAFMLIGFNLPAVGQGVGPDPSRPTFDCAKARSPLALLICSGEETARVDWDLRIASWARYFSLDEGGRASFWEDQDKWLRSLNQKCRLSNSPPFSSQQTSCVIGAYRGRAVLYRSKLTGDALAESKLTPEQLAQIQRALIALGFLNGEADGEFGPLNSGRHEKVSGGEWRSPERLPVYGAATGSSGETCGSRYRPERSYGGQSLGKPNPAERFSPSGKSTCGRRVPTTDAVSR